MGRLTHDSLLCLSGGRGQRHDRLTSESELVRIRVTGCRSWLLKGSIDRRASEYDEGRGENVEK